METLPQRSHIHPIRSAVKEGSDSFPFPSATAANKADSASVAPRKCPVVPQIVIPASSSPYFAAKSLVIKDPMLCPNRK